jgi:hypothetical protein
VCSNIEASKGEAKEKKHAAFSSRTHKQPSGTPVAVGRGGEGRPAEVLSVANDTKEDACALV